MSFKSGQYNYTNGALDSDHVTSCKVNTHDTQNKIRCFDQQSDHESVEPKPDVLLVGKRRFDRLFIQNIGPIEQNLKTYRLAYNAMLKANGHKPQRKAIEPLPKPAEILYKKGDLSKYYDFDNAHSKETYRGEEALKKLL